MPSAPSVGQSVDVPALRAAALSCGGNDTTFPASVLDIPASAELTAGPAADALRQFLNTPEAIQSGWPATGWRTVENTPGQATYLGSVQGSWWIATFRPSGSAWEFWEGGACQLQVDLPDGVSFATWRVDPARRPSPDATTIHLLGTEGACANGEPPVGRVLAPIVLPTEQAVTIVLIVRHVPGGADCPGNPEFTQDVTLADPLGTRGLFDGSTIPPTPQS